MIIDDPSIYLHDFGIICTSGAITGMGILDMPTQDVIGDAIITSDYTLTAKASDFGALKYGDTITVGADNYRVLEVRKMNDGTFCQIAIEPVTSLPSDSDDCTAFQIAMD